MSVFMLETDAVQSAGDSIISLSSSISSLSSSVAGYDTSNDDGFDFATPASSIASNLEACATKMQNTSKILENVVSSHIQLQSSLKFDASAANGSAASASGATTSGGVTSSGGTSVSSNSTSSGSSDNYSGGSNYSSGYSGGGSSYSGGSSSYSGGSSSGGAIPYVSAGAGTMAGVMANSIPGVTTVTDTTPPTTTEDTTPGTTSMEEAVPGTSVEEATTIDTDLEDVDYAYVKLDNLSDESKNIFNDVNYSDDGYAMVDNYYVIACDKSVGNVGDVIEFAQSDSSSIKCIVGTNTTTDEQKSIINFIVDSNSWSKKTPLVETENLIKNNINVTNLGKYKEVS